MTQVKEKIEVPKIYRRAWTETLRDENEKNRKNFESIVVACLNEFMPTDWPEYIFLKWTDTFFYFSESKGWGKNIKGFKQGCTFDLKVKDRQTLIDFVQNKKNYKAAVEDRHAKEQRLQKLCKPLFADTPKDIQGRITNYLEIEIAVMETKYQYNSSIATCTIKKNGEISHPEYEMSYDVETLEQAHKFIEMFTPIHHRLLAFAEEIKQKLPKEYFS